uniref:Reverse transcriptase domain-containing protein n=1 Tax=Oryzias sinensis TaxID=183150 RepID=A0A8C7YBY5_9TELE
MGHPGDPPAAAGDGCFICGATRYPTASCTDQGQRAWRKWTVPMTTPSPSSTEARITGVANRTITLGDAGAMVSFKLRGASVLCSPDGRQITFQNGHVLIRCRATQYDGQWFLQLQPQLTPTTTVLLVKDADKGIEEILTGLWYSGVIEHSHSLWCTPFRPVLKADGKTYRMAHDLRAVNDVTISLVLPVPDTYRMLSTLTPQCVFRHLFAFQYRGGIMLLEGCVLLMLVDDLLLVAPTAETCLQLMKDFLLKLYDLGFEVSNKKLQCQTILISIIFGNPWRVTGRKRKGGKKREGC